MEEKGRNVRPFQDGEVSAFCGQLALILKSGISALEGITTMQEDAASPEEREILNIILRNLESSGSLATAFKSVDVFPSYMLRMVELGEEAGKLDQVMDALCRHYNREDQTSKSIRHALTYPLIMAGVMILVILILLVKVMPIFNQVFIQLGTELTGISRALMSLGEGIRTYSVVIVILAALFFAAVFFGMKTASGRRCFRKLGDLTGITRSLSRERSACRFAGGMALTLSGGLGPDQSMVLAASLCEDPDFRKKLDDCKKQLEEGKDLAAVFRENQIFSGVYSRLISIGEKTGSLDQAMDQVAALYQEEIDNRVERMLSVLEPTMVILLSLIVGVILLTVMLPLMGIMSGM